MVVCIILIFMAIIFLMTRDTSFPFKRMICIFFFKTKQSLLFHEKSKVLTTLKYKVFRRHRGMGRDLPGLRCRYFLGV